MFEKKLVAALVVVLLAGLTIGYSIAPDLAGMREEIDKLERMLSENEGRVKSLQAQVKALQEELAKVEELNAEIRALQQQLETRILGVYFSPRRRLRRAGPLLDRESELLHPHPHLQLHVGLHQRRLDRKVQRRS